MRAIGQTAYAVCPIGRDVEFRFAPLERLDSLRATRSAYQAVRAEIRTGSPNASHSPIRHGFRSTSRPLAFCEMIKPEFRTTKTRKICHGIMVFINAWYIKYLLGPIAFVIPFTFLGTVVQKKDLLSELPGGQFLIEYQIPLILIFIVAIVASKSVHAILLECSKPNSCVENDEILAIVESIDHVVSSKNQRFLEASRQALREKWSAEQIFKNITKPEQQIALLVYAIQGVFEYIYRQEVRIKVGLMAIKENKPIEWFAFAPKEFPPKTGPDVLSSKSSAIMRALEAGDLIVVEKMSSEIRKKNKKDRKCVKGMGDDIEGSLLAVPIYCPNTREPIYVLSVRANKDGVFFKEESERYRWILQEMFFKRILLEHQLYVLKEELAA